jgi:16S rRNA (guanine966-N2)-methyltransferase
VRVIGGTAGGIRLGRVPRGTRPVSDRAREGLFSSLGDRVEGARCADLFAGTGAMGIEALSRGAASCLFVDAGAAAVRAIRENLERTGLADRATVVRADVLAALGRDPAPIDLALVDPPYAHPRKAVEEFLTRLASVASPDAIVALTRPKGDHTDVIPVHWSVVRILTYGDTRILILQEAA